MYLSRTIVSVVICITGLFAVTAADDTVAIQAGGSCIAADIAGPTSANWIALGAQSIAEAANDQGDHGCLGITPTSNSTCVATVDPADNSAVWTALNGQSIFDTGTYSVIAQCQGTQNTGH